jgi:hypothetical protein
MISRKPIFDAVKGMLGRGYTTPEVATLDRAIDQALGLIPAPAAVSTELTDADFADAAALLGCSVAQIRAVFEVEASGAGWFQDVRGDILARDGPGGFLDGPDLPKILFEAHIFDRETKGKFRASHPNLSSAVWNRALYVGGQAEYIRLDQAMALDRTAALRSASWGAAQIMGFNHKLAGFTTVEAFVDAMKSGARAHLMAFVEFVKNAGLVDALRAITAYHASARAFASGYNGTGYAKNEYHIKIARAFAKWNAA